MNENLPMRPSFGAKFVVNILYFSIAFQALNCLLSLKAGSTSGLSFGASLFLLIALASATAVLFVRKAAGALFALVPLFAAAIALQVVPFVGALATTGVAWEGVRAVYVGGALLYVLCLAAATGLLLSGQVRAEILGHLSKRP